jgi:hypothetical protein
MTSIDKKGGVMIRYARLRAWILVGIGNRGAAG